MLACDADPGSALFSNLELWISLICVTPEVQLGTVWLKDTCRLRYGRTGERKRRSRWTRSTSPWCRVDLLDSSVDGKEAWQTDAAEQAGETPDTPPPGPEPGRVTWKSGALLPIWLTLGREPL